MKCLYSILSVVCFLGGCAGPLNYVAEKIDDAIDIDVSVDYCRTETDGSRTCIEIVELDNIESLVV